MSALEPRCLECRDKGYVVSYWATSPGPHQPIRNVSCFCATRINLQCNKCGWQLRHNQRDRLPDESQDTERAAIRDVMREAEAAHWTVGKHGSDEDLCPGCAGGK